MMKGINSLLLNSEFSATRACSALREEPFGFIDIGARGGVHPLVEPLAGVTSVLAFDADEAECKRMEKELSVTSPFASLRIIPAAIFDQIGSATLYQFNKSVTDSLLPENPLAIKRYNIKTCERIGTVPLNTTTLDEVLFGSNSCDDSLGEFLKIDAQGADLDILTGAQRTLDERTVAIVVEAYFFPQYKRNNMFSEIEIFLRDRGFFFYGFEGMHFRSSGCMNKLTQVSHERAFWADAVFFKDPIPVGFNQKALTERQKIALFASSVLMKYYDFALELSREIWTDNKEVSRLEKLIHQLACFSPEETYQELMALAERVKSNPERANFEVGRFVDDRRWINDYDNVLPYR